VFIGINAWLDTIQISNIYNSLLQVGGFMAGVEGRIALVTGASQGIGRAMRAQPGKAGAGCRRN
jgi:hypothetical protein